MSTTDEALHVQRLEVVRVEPGDVIVVTVDPKVRATPESMDKIRECLGSQWPDNDVLFMGGVGMSVVRSAPAEGKRTA